MIWKVNNTGKIQYLLIVVLFSLYIYIKFVIEMSSEEDGGFVENAIGSFWIFIPLILAWMFTVPKFILKKKIPLSVEISPDFNKVIITEPKNKIMNIKSSDFAYSYNNHQLYGVFVVFRKITAKRGHTVYKIAFTILALEHGFGWNNKKISDLNMYLEKHNFETYRDGKKRTFMSVLLDN